MNTPRAAGRRVIVLGAGPAGLTCAQQMARTGWDVTVLDREPIVGGVSATFERRLPSRKTVRCDYGPHAFHVKNPIITELLNAMLGDELSDKHRNVNLFVRKRYFEYPLKFYEVMTRLSPLLSARMILDYLLARVWYALFPKPDANFRIWGIKRFGKTLYDFSFGKYTERVWGIPATEISAELGRQKIQSLDLKKIIQKLLGGKGEEQATYWHAFLYPEDGIGRVWEAMERDITHHNGKVILNADVKRLEKTNSGWRVVFQKDGREEAVEGELICSSIPLQSLVKTLGPLYPPELHDDAENLKFRGIILNFCLFNKPKVIPVQWTYLLDPQFRCNRVTEQNNLGALMSPPDKSINCFELASSPGDEAWALSDAELRAVVEADMKRIPEFRGLAVEEFWTARVADAYPLYDLGFESRLNRLREAIKSLDGIYSFGRQGLFLNHDIHDSMEMGMILANYLSTANSPQPANWYHTVKYYWRFND